MKKKHIKCIYILAILFYSTLLGIVVLGTKSSVEKYFKKKQLRADVESIFNTPDLRLAHYTL